MVDTESCGWVVSGWAQMGKTDVDGGRFVSHFCFVLTWTVCVSVVDCSKD